VDASIVGGAARHQQRDLRSWVGPAFELVESKLHPPWMRPGIVPRSVLVQRLLASHTAPVICVVAPPGYGKTTLLAQWARRKGGRVGWVTVDRRDNDPVVLLTYLAVAVDRVEPIDQGLFGVLAAPGGSVVGTVLPRLAAAVAALTQPVALVVDNVDALDNPQCLDAIAELAAHLPGGSQLALAGRTTPRLPVALLDVPGRVVAIGVDELKMDQREALGLLQGAGVRLADPEVAELVWRTGGWPVGLYLAALARKAGPALGSQGDAGVGFSGDDRFMADYLWGELLSQLPEPTVSFITGTAVLDRMCGPLCDAVLDISGSADLLASLARSNLLLIRLDRQRQWYRYHHLFRGLLRAELDRREPQLVQELHARAALWFEANGLPETAIDHAQAAGDADKVAHLVAGLAQGTYASGRVDTVRRWIGWFEERGLIDRYPLVVVQGALLHMLVGQPAAAERWADAAERGSAAAGPGQEPSTVETLLALLRGLMCRSGVERMRADAEFTRERLGPDSQWRPAALLLEGTAYLLAGQADRADPILADAVEVATHTAALPAASAALAERCIVALERNEWPQAEALAELALAIVRARQLDNYIDIALVYAVAARTALHRGDVRRAHEHLARAARLRPLLNYAIPWAAVQALLEMVHAYLALNDSAGARALLREANDVLRQRPDLGTLSQQATQLGSKASGIPGGIGGASSLTKAELRLLPLLPTQLTYREIGDRLYLSQNTVKKQAISIHRKLGVSSRSEAVERARQLNLLG
jgi:LuxR family maltose regulon positive regulatory protein